MSQTVIADREFTVADQERFAVLSGDCNPLHMNAKAARRTIASHLAVHGMHTVLWSLDSLYRKVPGLPPIASIAVRFEKMIHLGDRVRAVLTENQRMNVMIDGVIVLRMWLAFGAPIAEDNLAASGPILAPDQPRDLTFEQAAASFGRIDLVPAEPAARMFAAVASAIGAHRVAWLARSSFLVGMVSPGLHSIYSGFNLTAVDTAANDVNALDFRVVKSDPRFKLIKFAVAGGGWAGSLDAHARSAPVSQARIGDIAPQISPHEFRGTNALVIGGSRGVGEIVAKILGAGGAHVMLTYVMGKDDARNIQSDIIANGGHCDILQYDVRVGAREQLSGLNILPDQLYYLATPQIFRRKAAGFIRERFDDFLTFYVTGFYDLCWELRSKGGKSIAAFYPSSVAVETRPPNMTEYTMAKAAGEILCADMQAFEHFGKILVRRLPRLLTDQTATLMQKSGADPIAVMLPIVRELHAN